MTPRTIFLKKGYDYSRFRYCKKGIIEYIKKHSPNDPLYVDFSVCEKISPEAGYPPTSVRTSLYQLIKDGALEAKEHNRFEGLIPGSIEYNRAAVAERTYGLSYNNYLEVIKIDECEICSSKEKICIDHDHKTGKFRGRLCASCNFGLGAFQDDIEKLTQAIEYLKSKSLKFKHNKF